MGWILENNDAMNRGMEGMGGRLVKKYRVYERTAVARRPLASYTRHFVPEPADNAARGARRGRAGGGGPAPARARPRASSPAWSSTGRARPRCPATAAAATGGFILGVAAFMLLRVLRRPSAARSLSRRRARVLAKRRGVDVQATRSFLVDVHLLKR